MHATVLTPWASQYTVTMFLVDVSASMGKTREVAVPGTSSGEPQVIEMTNLEWSLQFVMLKIQEMVSLPAARCAHSLTADTDLQWKEDRQMWRHPLRERRLALFFTKSTRIFGNNSMHTSSLRLGTRNAINEANGGYENVTEYIPIAQPNASTLAKLASLKPSTVSGDRAWRIYSHTSHIDVQPQRLTHSLWPSRPRTCTYTTRRLGLAKL